MFFQEDPDNKKRDATLHIRMPGRVGNKLLIWSASTPLCGTLAASFKRDMGQLRLTVLLLLVTTISQGQSDFDLNDIKFNGLEFHTTSEVIIKSFGAAKKVATDYECGFFTNDQEGGPYYQIVYPNFNYIGSDKEDFFLQNVKFDLEGKIKISYRGKELSGQTTKEDFVKIVYGDKDWERLKDHFDIDVLLIYSKKSDDGAKFTFRDGRLLRFEYWTPC